MADIEDVNPRTRWPKGILGALHYFLDHVVFRHTRPVDWSTLRAVESGPMLGRPIFHGGFFHLDEEEAIVFDALGKSQNIEGARIGLGMSDERIDRCLERIARKSGVRNNEELIELASRHVR